MISSSIIFLMNRHYHYIIVQKLNLKTFYILDFQEILGCVLNSAVMWQAVEWSPTRDEFILIKGYQPAKATPVTVVAGSKVDHRGTPMISNSSNGIQ